MSCEEISEKDWKEQDGWIYAEDGYGYQEGYFSDIESLRDFCHDENIELPDFVYACDPMPIAVPNAWDIAEMATEESYEGAIDDLKGLEELQIALDEFSRKNSGVLSWSMNFEKIIVLDKFS